MQLFWRTLQYHQVLYMIINGEQNVPAMRTKVKVAVVVGTVAVTALACFLLGHHRERDDQVSLTFQSDSDLTLMSATSRSCISPTLQRGRACCS